MLCVVIVNFQVNFSTYKHKVSKIIPIYCQINSNWGLGLNELVPDLLHVHTTSSCSFNTILAWDQPVKEKWKGKAQRSLRSLFLQHGKKSSETTQCTDLWRLWCRGSTIEERFSIGHSRHWWAPIRGPFRLKLNQVSGPFPKPMYVFKDRTTL